MNTAARLEQLYQMAKSDPLLKQKLLDTANMSDPTDTFCKISCEAGCALSVGELFAMGQEYSDQQCKSTNGGNPSPYDSFEEPYELFLSSLKQIHKS